MAKSLKHTPRFSIAKKVGERICNFRRNELHMNQKQYADYVGLPQGTISKIEGGDSVSLDNLCRIAEKCKLSTDSLLFGKPVDYEEGSSLGLSSEATELLNIYKQSPTFMEIVNRLLSYESIGFFRYLGKWKNKSIQDSLDKIQDYDIDGIKVSRYDIKHYLNEKVLNQAMYHLIDNSYNERLYSGDDKMFDKISDAIRVVNGLHFNTYAIAFFTENNENINTFYKDLDSIIDLSISLSNNLLFQRLIYQNENQDDYLAYDLDLHKDIIDHIDQRYGSYGEEYVDILDDYASMWELWKRKGNQEDLQYRTIRKKSLYEQLGEIEIDERNMFYRKYHLEKEKERENNG